MRRAVAALILSLSLFGPVPATVFAAQANEQQIRLEQVELTGVTVFTSDAMENTLELGAGDVVDRAKVVRTAENIQALYRIHGYEQVSIETRLVRNNVLEIQISEGKPTRVAEVEIVSDVSEARKSGEVWKRIERSLKSGVGIQPGDIMDQEKIGSVKRGLQDLLTAQEYVGAKIEDVKAIKTEAPEGFSNEQKSSAGRWVRLQFHIRPGDRVTFGFRGNNVLTASRLAALVEEQRTLGLGSDFVGIIRARIEEEYRSLGFARVRVDSYTFEKPRSDERHITYSIQEGPRVTIDSLDFDGNSVFSVKELRAQFYALAPGLVQRQYYVEKDVQRAAELLIEWMKSKGYLGAKLITINRSYVPRRRESERNTRVRLVIYLYESEQTTVQSVRLSGVSVFTQEEIQKMLGIKEETPLNIFSFSEGIETLKAAYRAKGYLAARMLNEGTDRVIRYLDENRSAEIFIEMEEGAQFRVSRVEIEGNRKTRESVILREIQLKQGDVIEEPKLGESEANLRRLGIFSVVRAAAVEDPNQADHKILKLTVEEADPGVIAGGPGFRNDLGIRGFTEFGYSNLWGINHGIFLNASANRRLDASYRFAEYQTMASYNWPWFAGVDVNFRPTISLSGTQYRNFDAVTAAIALNWEKRLLRRPSLTGLFTYSLERVIQFNATDVADNGIFRIGSVIPGFKLDMRDNPLAPRSGFFAHMSYEVADPLLLSQRAPSPIGYTRFQLRTDYTIPVAKMVSWFWSFRSGFERSTVAQPGDNADGAIPLIKQFALGGAGSLRGFDEQELNHRDKVIKGTLSYVNYRTQIDLPVSGNLRFGPFMDAANLQVDTFSFGNLRYGAGFGFHYLTPVGPVNLDWGFKLDPRPGEDENQFYFSIGVL